MANVQCHLPRYFAGGCCLKPFPICHIWLLGTIQNLFLEPGRDEILHGLSNIPPTHDLLAEVRWPTLATERGIPKGFRTCSGNSTCLREGDRVSGFYGSTGKDENLFYQQQFSSSHIFGDPHFLFLAEITNSHIYLLLSKVLFP